MAGQAAARQGDSIVTTCIHTVQTATGAPTQAPHPFSGSFDQNLSRTVRIGGRPAAIAGSRAMNMPPHIPNPLAGSFMIPPLNQAEIIRGSGTVKFDGQPAARVGDSVRTCSEMPPGGPHGTVSAGAGSARVFIGD